MKYTVVKNGKQVRQHAELEKALRDAEEVQGGVLIHYGLPGQKVIASFKIQESNATVKLDAADAEDLVERLLG